MKQQNLCSAITKIGIGYLFLHLNLNLGTINILPNWVAYILFVQVLPILGEEEESANLLKPLGIVLGVLEGVYWVNTGFLGNALGLGFIDIIVSVISLYFHFQLLTNLANIAHKYECSKEKSLLLLRTVKTVLITLLAVTNQFQLFQGIAIGILIVVLVVTFGICMVLFSFRQELEEKLKRIRMIENAQLKNEVVE